MSGQPDLTAEAGRWLRFAREDLNDARTLLANEDSAPRNVCWHAPAACL